MGYFKEKMDHYHKNLLNYQTSEYDCGPVSLLNGIRYLFEREEIVPDLVKFIMKRNSISSVEYSSSSSGSSISS